MTGVQSRGGVEKFSLFFWFSSSTPVTRFEVNKLNVSDRANKKIQF